MNSFELLIKDALFLDFDGTLAELQDNAAAVLLAPVQTETVLAAAETLGGALAVLSGRDIADLAQRVPEGVLRIGNHGLYVAEPGNTIAAANASAPDHVRATANRAVKGLEGTWVEAKGPVLAIHYRGAPDHGAELHIRLKAGLDPKSGYSLQAGKFVYELKPSAANKGAALAQAMLRPEFSGRRPVMIGDDTTDEDAFVMAQQLGGVGVKVGDGTTQANIRLVSILDVYDLLGRLVEVGGQMPASNKGPSEA